MTLGEKLRYLRSMEGTLRGLNRDMTQQEVVSAIKAELSETISQAYLSQIERGVRPHLTNKTRLLLAKFFKVHPGYLVDDPEGFNTELLSDFGETESRLDLWLVAGSENFRSDVELSQSLLAVSRHDDSRKCLLLLGAILDTPELADRLMTVLRPDMARDKAPQSSNGSK
jgi:transcriptional regulator with XRE-family HTH domain